MKQFKFNIGQLVYLRTDNEQHERIVVAIQVTDAGCVYKLAHVLEESWHYACEIAEDKDILKTMS